MAYVTELSSGRGSCGHARNLKNAFRLFGHSQQALPHGEH
jgi:hypothetical protein